MSTYVHHIPGRLRIKTPHLKQNLPKTQAISMALQCTYGITHCTANPITGSLLIHYDAQVISFAEIQALLNRRVNPDDRLATTQIAHAAARAAHHVIRLAHPIPKEVLIKIGLALCKAFLEQAAEKLLARSAAALIAAIL